MAQAGEIFDTADDKAGFWEVLMTSIGDEHLPVKKVRVKPQDVPYMSREWGKNATRAKRRAARKYQKEQTRENWENKRKLRNEQTDLQEKLLENTGKHNRLSLNLNPVSFIKQSCPS